MKENIEIPFGPCDVHVVYSKNRVSYSFDDGNTIMTISTLTDSHAIKNTVSKYRNGEGKFTIQIDRNDYTYIGIEPCISTEL